MAKSEMATAAQKNTWTSDYTDWTYDGPTTKLHSIEHLVFAADGECIAMVMDHGHGAVADHARLIAAAPDMLASLKAIEQWALETGAMNAGDDIFTLDSVRAAIAKAA